MEKEKTKREYGIYIRNGAGTPYINKEYPDVISAKRALEIMVNFEEERNRMYFVDNDFFENKYNYIGSGVKYMSIRVREVSEWKKYSENEARAKLKEENENDNIINIQDYLMK